MRFISTSVAVLFTFVATAQNFSGGFNFSLPPGDSTAQRFLPEFSANPITDFVGVDNEGHFSANGKRIRFWGVNTTTGGNFPVKDKAPFIAARLRKMGFNLVRFHHADNPWTDNNGSIFDQNSNTTRVLNTPSLDRLHFFLAQMKRNGIYANLNLHVSRTFKPGDGVPHTDSLPEFAKAVTMFDRQLIALQKEYARQLLTTVNPYTGLAPVDDPVVGMVEISNENTLYGYWKDGWLRHYSKSGNLAMRHVDTLDRRWQTFLQEKYPSQTALATAWNVGVVTGGQNQQIVNGGFETNPASNWSIELHNGATATLAADNNSPFAGQASARVNVTNVTGTDWHIQFKQVGGNITAGQHFSVKFAARASQNATINVAVMRDNAPYTWYAGAAFNLTTQWKAYTFNFTAPENNSGAVRISFSFNNQTGQYWFDNVSVAAPEVSGLLPGESLAAGNIYRPDYTERLQFTPARMADMAAFYLTLQRDYFRDMRRYLIDSLGVKVPITGSNAWGGPSDLYTQQDMDYADDHAYWDHPQFPDGAWSESNWLINNTPMVRSTGYTTINGVFSGLALKGKPYTVSEYRHSFPNRYEVEMMPWLAAYAGFHDADGLMFFEYNGSHNNWETDRVEGFFPIHRNSVQMALSPLYAYAYRQGLIAPATQQYEIGYSPEYLFGLPQVDNRGRWEKYLPYDARLGLTQAIRAHFPASGSPDVDQLPAAPGTTAATSNGETTVDFNKGLLTTAAPQFASICGFLNQAPAIAGDLKVTQGNDFGAAAWLSLDGNPLRNASESLIAIASKTQNANMIWTGTATVSNNWGTAPTSVFPLQLSLELALDADSLRLYRLSPTGAENTSTLHLPSSPGKFTLSVNQSADKTMWYGLEAFGTTSSTSGALSAGAALRLLPNPASGQVQIYLTLPRAESIMIRLLDSKGVVARMLHQNGPPTAEWQETVSLEGLAAGVYMVECRAGGKVWGERLVVR